MKNTCHTIEYGDVRASVMQGVRTICYVKAAGAAIRRAGFLLVFLLALSPICELFGLMSVSHIAENASHTKGFGELFGFLGTAFMNTEIEVQTITSIAGILIVFISAAFIKEIFSFRFFRGVRS